jgi:S1-C subfamily serine protease
MRILLTVLAAFVLFNTARAQSRVETLRRLQATTVLIDSDGFGSGVLVSRLSADGHYITYVWTAAHVVMEARKLDSLPDILKPRGLCSNITVLREGQLFSASVVAYTYDETADLALLRIWTEDFETNSVSFYFGPAPDPGTDILHVGNFYGTNAPSSVSIGIFSAAGRSSKRGVQDQISCPMYPGSSGGGFYLTNGQCIGLANARIEEMLGFIVPTREIQNWARTKGLEWALDPALPFPE